MCAGLLRIGLYGLKTVYSAATSELPSGYTKTGTRTYRDVQFRSRLNWGHRKLKVKDFRDSLKNPFKKMAFWNARKRINKYMSAYDKRNNYNWRPFKKRKYIAKTPYKGKLKKLLQQPLEVGHSDITLDQRVSTTTTGVLLNGLTRGTSATTRSSFNVGMISLYYHFTVIQGTSALSNRVRICLVYDKQANKALPAFTNVFRASSTETMVNLENSSRFRILRSYYFCLSGRDATTGSTASTCF